MTESSFADNLKRIRLARHFTQQEVADHIGVERTTYTYWERAHTEPNIKNLAELYSVTIDQLVYGTKESTQSDCKEKLSNKADNSASSTQGRTRPGDYIIPTHEAEPQRNGTTRTTPQKFTAGRKQKGHKSAHIRRPPAGNRTQKSSHHLKGNDCTKQTPDEEPPTPST